MNEQEPSPLTVQPSMTMLLTYIIEQPLTDAWVVRLFFDGFVRLEIIRNRAAGGFTYIIHRFRIQELPGTVSHFNVLKSICLNVKGEKA